MVFTPPGSPAAPAGARGDGGAGGGGHHAPGVQNAGVVKRSRGRPPGARAASGGGGGGTSADCLVASGPGGGGSGQLGSAGSGGAARDEGCVDETCWMCHYQTDEEAKRLMEFVARSVGYMDLHNISAQVSVFIVDRYSDVKDKDGNTVELRGATPADVERHIRRHVLHPKVRIAVLIQELLEFQNHLRNNLVVEDVATGLSAVDKGNVELYLKVISQVMNLYKSETSAMLFSSDDT